MQDQVESSEFRAFLSVEDLKPVAIRNNEQGYQASQDLTHLQMYV